MSSERFDEAELRDRVEGSRRNLPLARLPDAEPPESYTELAKDYPVSLVFGGLLAGIVAGSLLPRGIGRKVARTIVSGALVAGEIGRNYSRDATRKAEVMAQDSRSKVAELGGRAASAGKRTMGSSRDLGVRAAREAIRLATNLRR